MSVSSRANEIRSEFELLEDWELRYAHLIDLGRHNPPLQDTERTETNRVRGCASQVWMVINHAETEPVEIRAESDALIVSGLIALLTRLYSGAEAREILDFDASALLDEIGVTGALSAQRSNGLAAMIRRIRSTLSELS